MNKETYLQELRKALKVLPQQDRDEAVEFYEEYFDEAGIENEAKVIEELGEPKSLGKKILIDIVDRRYAPDSDENSAPVPAAVPVMNNQQTSAQDQTYAQPVDPQMGNSQQNVPLPGQQPLEQAQPKKKSSAMTGLKIALAAFFAIPLSPVVFALMIVVCVLIMVAFITLFALVASGAGVLLSGIVVTIAGIISMFISPVAGLCILGSGLTAFGLGVFMMIGFVTLTRLLAKGLSNIFGRIVHKKNRKQAAAQVA